LLSSKEEIFSFSCSSDSSLIELIFFPVSRLLELNIDIGVFLSLISLSFIVLAPPVLLFVNKLFEFVLLLLS